MDASIPIELQLVLSPDVVNLRCLPVVRASIEAAPSLVNVLMDSAYFSYQARASYLSIQSTSGLQFKPPQLSVSSRRAAPAHQGGIAAVQIHLH